MPIKRKLMKNLKKEYGSEKGKDVYWGMYQKSKMGNKRIKKIFN